MSHPLHASMNDDVLLEKWRTGQPDGRGVYAGPAAEVGVYLGVMDTFKLAEEACEAHNKVLTGEYMTPVPPPVPPPPYMPPSDPGDPGRGPFPRGYGNP
jgi:hypothetical protein